MDPGHMALLIPIIGVCIPIVAIWTKHQQKMAEIKAQAGQGLSTDVQAKLDALQRQILELKDTSSRFDLALDNNQDHLDKRIAFLEEQNVANNSNTNRYPTASKVHEEQKVILGNR